MTLSFPPDVFARIEPALYLQRHLALGLRPVQGLRKFHEFRPVTTQPNALDNEENIVGSALTKVGGTTVICGITLSTSEAGPGGVYPNVEILRGGGSRNSPPTQEEMLLSQQAYNQLCVQLNGSDIFQQDGIPELHIVLTASIQVLSRTGPCYDAVWTCLVKALKSTQIPTLVLDPDTKQVNAQDPGVKIGHEFSYSSTFGVVEMDKGDGENEREREREREHERDSTAILADLEGDTEEKCVPSRIQVSMQPDGVMTGCSIQIVGSTASEGKTGIQLQQQHVRTALDAAQRQSKLLATL